jgi:hypothetical protein
MTVAATTHARGRPDRAALVVSLFGFVFGLAWLTGILLVFRQTEVVDGELVYVLGDHWGYDIEAYVRAAGRLVSEGTLYLQEQMEAAWVPGGKDYYHYSPPIGIALVPLTDLPEHDSSAVWFMVKTAALLAACLLMPVKLPVRALTFVGVAVSFWAMRDLVLGNVGVLLVLPVVVAWRWLDRPLGSIALAATISVRPSTGVLLLWQLLRRRWAAAAWTIGAGGALILLTLPFVGVEGYREYLDVLGNMVTPGAGSENRDLGATLVTLGLDEGLIDAVRVASIALGAALVLLGLRRDRELGFMITLTASMLMVPLMWEYYLIMLALPLALLADRWRPVVLLVLVLSWLPSAVAPALLLATLALLFLLPTRTGDTVGAGAGRRGDAAVAALGV